MVGTKKSFTPSSTSRLRRSSGEPPMAQRLRRNISPKNMDITAGLSWREERELNKALYASLQETKKVTVKSEPDLAASYVQSTSGMPRRSLTTTPRTLPRRQSPRSSKPVQQSPILPPPLEKKVKPCQSIGADESSQDSMRSSTTSCSMEDSKGKTKVRAQRKFAQMHAYGNTMVPSQHTPVKQTNKSSPIKVFPKRAKTEDFLTFLCLRGTQVLPPHLDFFNFSRDEGDSSLPTTPSNGGQTGSSVRESSPSSSSTSCSNLPDEIVDSPATQVFTGSRVTPSRKAARACAGTPETARGLAGMRPRFGKKSHIIAKGRNSHLSLSVTPAKSTRSYSTGTPSPGKLSPLKRGRRKGVPGRFTAAERLSMKRKAIATLTTSKHSPVKKQSGRKSLFIDQSSGVENESGSQRLDKKNIKVRGSKMKTTRKTSRSLVQKSSKSLSVKSANAKKTKKTIKPETKFIADRLPQRKAKLRWNKYYIEDDEFDNEISFVFKDSPDLNTSSNRKRKTITETDLSLSDPMMDIPLKKTRLQKVEKKSQKAKSHGKIMLRQVKKKNKENNLKVADEPKINECDTSEGVHTRSGSLCRSDRPGTSDSTGVTLDGSGDVTPTTTTGKSSVVSEERKFVKLRKFRHIHAIEEKLDKKDKKLRLSKMIEKRRKIKIKYSKGTEQQLSNDKKGMKNSGSVSENLKKRIPAKKKSRETELCPKDIKIEPFPGIGEPAKIVEAPYFYPTEEEFTDPIKYIQTISTVAEPYGMCKIIPPRSWKPDGKINEELRFTTQKQYINKLYHRFGPNVCQLNALKRHLEAHGVSEPIPVIGGVEIDLCKLSAVIEEFGGMQNVIEKKKLVKVADVMGIPKSAQDRGTKLYDAYCKFLVSYDMLSSEKKRRLEGEVTEERTRIKGFENEEDCVVKGKNMSLVVFKRTARNTGSMWLRDHTTENVEKEYWDIVKKRKRHVVVHGGHIDTQAHNCTIFSSKKDNHYYSHPWNLNNLPHSPNSLLRYLGHVSGVTVPTLHVGMAFTTSCWSKDIHNLPYVQYLHAEADTIRYCVPESQEDGFKSVMKSLVPTLVTADPRWLREDTVMVPPDDLAANGVPVSRCIQKPGQFVVVFPRSYTSTTSCGYSLAESVHFATPDWLKSGHEATQILNSCYEEELFSMDELLCRIAEDPNSPKDFLAIALPWLEDNINNELERRQQLFNAGLKSTKRMCTANNLQPPYGRRGSCDVEEIVTTCEVSKKICYLSLVLNEAEDLAFSLEHGLAHIQKKRNIKSCKLMYRHSEEELRKIVSDVKERLSIQDTVSPDGGSPRRKLARKSETKS